MAVNRTSLLWPLFLGLIGCSGDDAAQSGFVVNRQSTDLVVSAQGEIISAESLPIALPPGIRLGFNIAWLAPEFSEVRAGDIVARFDDQEIIRTQQQTVLNVAKSEFRLADMDRLAMLEEIRIDHETGRVDGERDITEAFASIDERLMSRNEIIDALSDVEFLDVEAGFLEWQWETFDQRVQAEQNIIEAEKDGELDKLSKQTAALEMMVLRSPADGTFVYASTPWGEKIAKGKRVFPGMPVGLLPVRGRVKAKLFVAENDAVGIAVDQATRITLDMAPTEVFTATVSSVSTVASQRSRDNPQKFFVVEAVIEDIDADIMRVGAQLNATIITGRVEDAIVVPAQAVYSDGDEHHVFVTSGSGSEKRVVELAQRSPDLVEIVQGLQDGERLLLIAPDGGA